MATIYVVMVEDRHTDTEAHLFSTPEKAIAYAQGVLDDNSESAEYVDPEDARMSDEDLLQIERRAIPGTGSCGGMYTANTMSSAFEALGISLIYSSTMANPHDEKMNSAKESAKVLVEALRRAGPKLNRDSIQSALEGLRKFDVGGLEVSYSRDDHTGLDFADLSIISDTGKFRR